MEDQVFGIPVTATNIALTLFALVVGQMVVSKNPIIVSIGKGLQWLVAKWSPPPADVAASAAPDSPSDAAMSDAIYVLRTHLLDDPEGQKLVDALDSHWWGRRSGKVVLVTEAVAQ